VLFYIAFDYFLTIF